MKISTFLNNVVVSIAVLTLALPCLAQEKPAKKTNAEVPATAPEKQPEKQPEKTDKTSDKGNKESANEGKSCPVLPPVENFTGSTLACVMGCKECSIFSKAIHDSGLENMLAEAAECTLFVPVDTAFDNWSQEDKDALFSCPAAMSVLVLNHVCPSNLSPEALGKFCKEKIDSLCQDAVSVFGEENREKCREFCCHALKKMHCHGWTGSEDGMAPQTEKDRPLVKCVPQKIFKCDNGYVYVMDKVQVPRVLKVYKKLAAATAAPTVMVEEVSISVE